MAETWESDGAWGSAARIPVDQWFPVRTDTGEWQLPGPPILASRAGMPDVHAPAVMGSTPDQAPLSLGQVAGGFAPQLGPQPRLAQMARMSGQGLLPEQPSMWQSIARAIGQASPTGQRILQASDQQQQQQLQNRLTMRRQQLLEEQEARQGVQEAYKTLVAISQIKNKALRNMQFDRFAARAAESGQALPADFIEAYKKSSLAEGEGIAQAYGPLLEKAGFSPEQTARILEGGDLETIKGLLEGGLKVKKAGQEDEEARQLQRIQAGTGGTLADVSGVTQPSAPLPGTDQRPRGAVEGAQADGARAPMPIRMNNPLNIKQGKATQKWIDQGVAQPGDAATDGGRFLKFQSPSAGVQAAQDLLTGPTYSGLSVDAALKKWSNNGYGGEIVSGVDGQKKIADLTPDELTRTMGAMIKREGGAVPDTSMMVAGPGAPAPTRPTGGAGDTAALTRLDQAIAAKQGQIQQLSGLSSERANKVADNMRADLKILQEQRNRLEDRMGKERERLEEPGKLRTKQEIEQPYALERAREQRALTPIDPKTQEVLANNKSVYRSIGKIEEYLREGTDLPADFVNLVAQDTPGISAWLQSDPKNITGLAKQWETKFKAATENDPRANRFLAALGNMRDLVIRERSGGSVTGNELDRAMGAFMGSLPNINQAFSLFAQNLANVKETVVDALVTSGAASRPLSGGKAMYGTLPKEIRDRIDYAERGEDYPKATMPAKRPQVTGPITQVSQ